jgi:hypothetical protein
MARRLRRSAREAFDEAAKRARARIHGGEVTMEPRRLLEEDDDCFELRLLRCLVTVPAPRANRPAPVVSVPVQLVGAVGVAVRAHAAEETSELAPMPDLPSGSPREDATPRVVAPVVRRTGAAPTAPTETAREQYGWLQDSSQVLDPNGRRAAMSHQVGALSSGS